MMKFSVETSTKSGDLLVVPLFEKKKPEGLLKQLDTEHDGLISNVLNSKDFEGKLKSVSFLYTKSKDHPRILLVGLGEAKKCDIRRLKQVLGLVIQTAQSKKLSKIILQLSSEMVKQFSAYGLGKAMATSMEMADYAFDNYKEKDAKVCHVREVLLHMTLETKEKNLLLKGIAEGQSIAEGTEFLRTLGNTPPSEMTPTKLGKEAQKLERLHKNVKVKVLGETEIKKLKMGSFLAVSNGSEHEPKFIIVEFNNGKKGEKPTVLVGKGITFDSGGLSIKPAEHMLNMKFDMLGGATVLGSIYAAAKLNIKKNIVGLVPTCENMPGGKAYRPDDIVTAMNGKTIEVKNTDAEGRLILCDALVYASKYKPKEVIDLATLTGACVVAIGEERSGLFSQDEKIVEKLTRSADSVGELLWRLPLGEEYSEAMKSEIADYQNIGKTRYAGASTAAAFLEFFTDYPWAHIDLSGSYTAGKMHPWLHGGANGFGVQTMVEYLNT